MSGIAVRAGPAVITRRRSPVIVPRVGVSPPGSGSGGGGGGGGSGGFGIAGFQTWTEVGGVTYGASPDLQGPIGGHQGYTNIVTSGDYTETTAAGIQAALDTAAAGEVVFVPTGTSIDLGSTVLTIPSNVTLASDRGNAGNDGALFFSNTKADRHIIKVAGDNVRITGIQLKGHDDFAVPRLKKDGQITEAIRVNSGTNLEVDNCHIHLFINAGINIRDDDSNGHHIHHNYIHHIWSERGYGMTLNGCSATVEYNLFNALRHAVANTGRNPGSNSNPSQTGTAIVRVENNAVLDNVITQQFDMHSSPESNGPGSSGDGGECGVLICKNNLVHTATNDQGSTIVVSNIRGTPYTTGSEWTHNWLWHPTTWAITAILKQTEILYSDGRVEWNANLWDGENKIVRTGT